MKTYNYVSPRPGVSHGLPAPVHDAAALEEVIKVRADVVQGIYPTWFLANDYSDGNDIPELLKSRTNLQLHKTRPESCAALVQMDRPTDLALELHHELIARGYKYREDYGYDQFCDPLYSFMAFMRDLTAYNIEYMNKAFDEKYLWKSQRPEQLVNVEICLFTHDPAGSPRHYSYPAGHGTMAGVADRIVNEYFDLDADMKGMVSDACITFAQYRTLSGYHFAIDNISGYHLGHGDYD